MHRWYVKNALPRGTYDRSDELAVLELDAGVPFFFARLSDQNRGRWSKAPSGVFRGLQLGTTDADLARCVYEAIAFEVASWWERMGLGASALRVFGSSSHCRGAFRMLETAIS